MKAFKLVLIIILLNLTQVIAQQYDSNGEAIRELNNFFLVNRADYKFQQVRSFEVKKGELRINTRTGYQTILIDRLKKIKILKGEKFGIKFFTIKGVRISHSPNAKLGTTYFYGMKNKKDAQRMIELLNLVIEENK